MKKKLAMILLAVFVGFAFKSDKPAYVLYNQKGETVKYSKMLKKLQDADIVFFGELHTDPIAHWLQYEITKDLFEVKKTDLILGAEMFEADNQLIMDEYLAGTYAAKKFEAEIRLWGNYTTDYKPLVEFAKENKLKFIATNIPRRYASVVHKQGFEGLAKLSDEAKQFFSPDLVANYDKEVGCYKAMMEMAGMGGHVNENFPKAQAVKDATMAHFILKNHSKGKLSMHYNGAYHSDNFEGIVWWIKKLQPELNVVTISTIMQEDVTKFDEENIDRANYIIAVPETMTRTGR
jgi:uncharacterized iron-regulated protein